MRSEGEIPAKEGVLTHKAVSPTAASASNPLYGPSGRMLYRVTLATGLGFTVTDVDAHTGDEAANAALAQHPGCKVTSVNPAPQKAA